MSDSGYTPTTEDIREGFGESFLGDGSHADPDDVRGENKAAFDRWFAKVRAGERRLEAEVATAIRLAQEANDDCRRWSVLVTGLQAVIAEALRQTRRGNLMTPPWVIEALCQSPADALAAHDAVIREDQAKKDAEIVETFLPAPHAEGETCNDCVIINALASEVRGQSFTGTEKT